MPEQQKRGKTCLFVTIGSRTGREGRVTRVTTKAEYQGMALARGGDVISYDDGSEATIIDGAGFTATWEDKPLALIDPRMSNGDTITETLQDAWGVAIRDSEQTPRLFIPACTLPWSAAHGGSTHA